ncbi:hypothetical protein GCM10018952_74400 [Streptosporangium vulgare]
MSAGLTVPGAWAAPRCGRLVTEGPCRTGLSCGWLIAPGAGCEGLPRGLAGGRAHSVSDGRRVAARRGTVGAARDPARLDADGSDRSRHADGRGTPAAASSVPEHVELPTCRARANAEGGKSLAQAAAEVGRTNSRASR